ncbi:methyltransferase domain-containing protein [Streptomyces sp. NPDC058157]|uniref:methyltransferase domain-containing protein n=1 Tax=Streptomyces sp. NPDC058157 TaxID=3346360 RepID=UPI0036EB36F7
MAVVVVQRGSTQAPRAVREVLAAAGLTARTVLLTDGGGAAPDGLGGVDGLIILGGPRPGPPRSPGHVLVREALAAEVPVLALGAGALLLAQDPGPAEEPWAGPDGGRRLRLTAAAGTDPVFAGAGLPCGGLRPAAGALELPAGAVVLATCEGYPEQAFRVGASGWGVRFLPQGPDTADAWAGRILARFAALVAARAEHTATRAFFTRRADAWEERFAYQAPAYEAAVARMRLAPGGLALDLGCGTGRAMPALRAQVGPSGRVLGIDLTPAMLAAAARHGRTRHGDLLAADCTRLPLPDASVRGVFSAGLLGHLPDARAGLNEWARVTAPDGVLLLFHPSGHAERAARHGRPLDPADPLAEHNLRPALAATGWRLDVYEDAPHHFLARAVRRP